MFTPDEIPDIKSRIIYRVAEDQRLLEELRADVRPMASESRTIKPRTATSISLVASDGGNNQIAFDPFYLQLVRVVDSCGKKLFLDLISHSTDTEALSKEQFNKKEGPTPLGKMMTDLEVDPPLLSELCYAIPSPELIKKHPEKINPSWVQAYRDLCEWAVLYDLIRNTTFSNNTLIVKDGPLRNALINRKYFTKWKQLIGDTIDNIYQKDRRRVFLVGLFKHSKVFTRYQLAMSLEQTLPPGEPRYVRVPRELEAKSYLWEEFSYNLGPEGSGREAPNYVAGDLYFVRFGPRSGDPVWAVDIYSRQKDFASEIFGYLLADAINGFPVPFYPRCLQQAHEHAEVVGFDYDILQEEIVKAIRNSLPVEKQMIMEALRFNTDVSMRRYQ
jgi:hypothetical protein